MLRTQSVVNLRHFIDKVSLLFQRKRTLTKYSQIVMFFLHSLVNFKINNAFMKRRQMVTLIEKSIDNFLTIYLQSVALVSNKHDA